MLIILTVTAYLAFRLFRHLILVETKLLKNLKMRHE